jgi:hypothetical protein
MEHMMEQKMERRLFEMEVGYEDMIAEKRAWLKEMKVHREATEAYPEEMKSIVEHQEVSKEETAVEYIAALEDRHEDRHLAVGRRRQLKKRTKADGRSWKELDAVRKRFTHRVLPALRKKCIRRGPDETTGNGIRG